MSHLASPDRRLELSHAVNQLSDAVLRVNTAGEILQSLVDIAGSTLGVDRAAIYDVRLSRGTAVALCEWVPDATRVPTPTNSYSLSLFPTAARELARSGEWLQSGRTAVHPVLSADGADTLLHEHMSIQRLLWYPFGRYDDGSYLLVFNQVTEDRGWTPDEIEFVAGVASQTSLALMKVALLRERERTEAELRRSENRFRLFYDATPSMFFTVDRSGAVRSVNAFAEQHLGYTAVELLDTSVLAIVHPDDRKLMTAASRSSVTSPATCGTLRSARFAGTAPSCG
jgi:PAS domain-containing protein